MTTVTLNGTRGSGPAPMTGQQQETLDNKIQKAAEQIAAEGKAGFYHHLEAYAMADVINLIDRKETEELYQQLKANIPVYGGNTTSYTIKTDNVTLVVDAGTGLRSEGAPASSEPIHIALTHTHRDHLDGFDIWGPIYFAPITIYGRRNNGKYLEETLHDLFSDDKWPVDPFTVNPNTKIKEIDDEGIIEIGDLKVEYKHSDKSFHPLHGITSYKITTPENAKIVIMTDIELNGKSDKELASLEAFAHDADMLLIDAQYTPEEYAMKKGQGHTTYDVAVEFARKAGVKNTILTHHDPTHDDFDIWKKEQLANQYLEKIGRPEDMTMACAYDGMRVDL